MRRSPRASGPELPSLVTDTVASLAGAVVRERESYPQLSSPVLRELARDLRRALRSVERLLEESATRNRERAFAIRARSWRDATLDALRHARDDDATIRRIIRTPAGVPLTGFESGLGDPHDGGRTAARLLFGGDRCVFYKPRDATAEAATFDVLHWIDRARGKPARRLPALAPIGGHAWMAPVPPAPIARSQEPRAARRAGELLAILDMLQAIDGHSENLLRCGDSIVPVDLETVLQPRLRWSSTEVMDPEDPASVLRVGLLPSGFTLNVPGAEPLVHDSDGLGAWLQIHEDECCTGFADTYRALARNSGAIIESEPLQQLRGAPVRVVVRATRVYLAITRTAWGEGTTPRSSRATTVAGRAAAALRTIEPTPWPQELCASESRAIARLDVPRLTATSRTRALSLDGGVTMTRAITETGWSRVSRWLAHAGERDLRERLSVIRATLRLATLRRQMRTRAGDTTAARRARRK